MVERALGVDLGTVRIGLAISAAGVAVPADTLPAPRSGGGGGTKAGGRGGSQQAWADTVARQLDAAARERGVEIIVVGLPRAMSGRDTAAAQRARKVAAALAQYGLPVVLFDERLTSVQADRLLAEGGRSGVRRRQEVDQMAASLILQAWLDAQEA